MILRSCCCEFWRLARRNPLSILETSCRSGLVTRPASISNSRRCSWLKEVRCERSASIARSTRTQVRTSSSESVVSGERLASFMAPLYLLLAPPLPRKVPAALRRRHGPSGYRVQEFDERCRGTVHSLDGGVFRV